MFSPDQYELLDFGDGRKLERFGPFVVDRPSPPAEFESIADSTLWKSADSRYRRQRATSGTWSRSLPESWQIRHEDLTFELKATEFGHVGVFPEQADNWRWIRDRIRRAGRPLKVLNLFGYTGGASLAAAAEGAVVTHIDAAKNVVAWARRNAKASGLAEAPIRWIVEDCQKFVRRELRRGNRYDALIVDPPSYGHGPNGEPWKLGEHLLPLLHGCAGLMTEDRAFVLFTCHSPNFTAADIEAMLADAFFGHCQSGARSGDLTLSTATGRRLHSGIVARWP